LAFGGYNLEAAVAAARKGASSDGLSAQLANVVFSLAGAFHSQHFYATGGAEAMQAKSSVAMDLEGKYAVADFSYSPHAGNITFATLEPRGVSIVDQNRISRLVVKVHSKNPGPIQDIKGDISTPEQTVEEKNPTELIVKVAARRPVVDAKVVLPVTDPTLSEYLKANGEISSDNKQVIDQAREIAGKDKDAWSVARKLADWTYKNLTWRSVAVANASQTLATREADCSEFSQLYVSMARAVGLPARIVSGLAYGGASFGGHAWVEVWVGRWVELDPTWGTDFVDATHIRNSSSALVTAAALNLIDLEILEANRTPAEFQQSAAALAKEFTRGVATGDRSAIDSTFDLGVLTDELMGAGECEQMTELERRQILAGYKRAMLELFLDYEKIAGESKFRFIDVVTQGERAEAVCRSGSGHLVKLQLIKRNDRWHMLDVIDRDAGLQIIGESVRPYIQWIRKTRAGDKPASVPRSNLVRALLISPSNPTKSLELVETSLKSDPANQDLKFLKAKLLSRLKKEDEGLALFRQLVDEQPSYPAAIRELGYRQWTKFSGKDENAAEMKQVLELYQQYARLEPLDPEGHTWVAGLYARSNEFELAKSEYWKVVNLDPDNESGYVDLVEFLLENNLMKEVPAVLDFGDKHPEAGTDLFGSIMSNLYELDLFDEVERLAAMQPRRMQKSMAANIALGQSLIDNDKALKALAPLNFALSLDSNSIEARIELAYANRALSRWPAALRAAQQVLNLEPGNGEAHYLRACVLARTGKTDEAMGELSRSIELEPHRLYFFSDETDFKSLSALPAYTKLVAEAEKKKAEEKEDP
jgi:tetratricopeptide (TPR) repeat protein